ncbi:pentatricopeptide repeat-containing protein-like, chloroplastic [Iris pallida]|uniref:Pentatricopeptide repeat-containing protein-like, chloroplastic n=1 Tax=Iris pallida TaxID=29817 RepID=A0AAX6EZ32_IRIPA|nr:pentatricopeptide repeat-containing protein-like, chloroplastic [Iris pallida]
MTVTVKLPPPPLPSTSVPVPITHFPPNPKPLLLHRCKTPRDLRQIHAHLIKTRSAHSPAALESLLEASALLVPSSLPYALKLFDETPQPHAQLYNILIRAFNLSASPLRSLLLFSRMLSASVPADVHTLSCTLKACSMLPSPERHGRQVHAHAVKRGFRYEDGFLSNSLIHMYASCGAVGSARAIFSRVPDRGTVTWNAMCAGYFKAGDWGEVVALFRSMLESGAAFDEVTLISVLTACGRLGALDLGEWIGRYVEGRKGMKESRNLMTSLVDMYAKCGRVDRARELFEEMAEHDVVAWSAMISGYNQWNRCKEALELFHRMQVAKVEPNEVTMVSVLSSCSVMGALETGRWVHSYIKRRRLKVTVNLGTALVDFYAKSGCIESAIDAFEKLPCRNAWCWTVLIQGLASNGRGREALRYFSSMLEEADLRPNDLTFIAVLSACSHAGLVEEGQRYFDSMKQSYGLEPRIEHYGIMVDILGRAGLLDEAYKFVKEMPIEPNAIIWRTLLSSCKIHKNVKIGEESLEQIVSLEPRHSGDYILLSNIYASVGRWEDAMRVRNQMKEKGIKKIPGCSLIEVGGITHEFFAEDSAHPQAQEIYDKIEEMVTRIRKSGYVPNVADARLDAEEEEKEVSVSHHSEKLAIAFGLIKSPPGAAIRVSKNLRVCTDCHLATKMISKVYGREIIVRDRNRFHHFRDGGCSCNDYW